MPCSRRHRSSSGNSRDFDSSGTVVPRSSRASSSARSHRSSSTRHSTATASSRRSNHTSSASRPSSSSASQPPVSSASRSSMVSGTSSSRRPSSPHSSRRRSSAGRSLYAVFEPLSSRHSQAQSSSSGTAIDARSYASSSRAGTSRVSTNSTSRQSGISDETIGPWDSVSRVGTHPPSSQSQSTLDRNRVAYVVNDESDVCLCFRPPSNAQECRVSLACARGQQFDKRDYIAELRSQFLEARPDRLESIIDKYVRELADLIRLELYITSMERYQKRNGREDVRGQLDQISAKYESTMNTKQLLEAMSDMYFK